MKRLTVYLHQTLVVFYATRGRFFSWRDFWHGITCNVTHWHGYVVSVSYRFYITAFTYGTIAFTF